MKDAVRKRRLACASGVLAVVGLSAAALAWGGDDRAGTVVQAPDAAPPPVELGPIDVGLMPMKGADASSAAAVRHVASASPRAEAHVEGGGQVGSTVLLRGERSDGENLRFRWVQTQGKRVRLMNPEGATASFVMPDEPGGLGFLLVVSGPGGSDSVEVRAGGSAPNAPRNSRLGADAGDDQIALVGRQVTLNGSRSEPAGEVGYRWVQTGGPPARLKVEDGEIFAFTPTAPGVYRFALIVAAGSELSTPDEVVVTVGAGTRIGGPAGLVTAGDRSIPEPAPTQEVAGAALASIRGGAEAAESLATMFETAADRMDLYPTYADAFSEMSRRLEDVLPADPTHRSVWIEKLFGPLSAQTVEAMRVEGLDLRLSEARDASLTTSQKAALAEHFRLIAEGFRSTNRTR
ncbi:PKD domain-containing protein [Paludisphaera soli]|uniref:PKD domain-containing protein n=1 Tax=Paludisphaera soli TaxID=2712865 RepID=UPI0013ED8E69|nr:hypothetical protein [Paludisphaera soli]